jgi:dTDP-4-dehydrorhamnose 3,5-epimerase
MIERATKDAQSVTADWDVLQDLIAGVSIREVRHVAKDNGYVTEAFRVDWDLDDSTVEQVFQVTLFAGAISAWHTHLRTTDRLFVSRGVMKIVLYDDRSESTTQGMLNVFRFGDFRPALLVVPQGVWHGIQNLTGTDSSVLNVVDRAYAYGEPDHWRLPQDSLEIPYRFGPPGDGDVGGAAGTTDGR